MDLPLAEARAWDALAAFHKPTGTTAAAVQPARRAKYKDALLCSGRRDDTSSPEGKPLDTFRLLYVNLSI